ncbi:transposase [Pandoraea sp. SD6-2]|uniref:transposase n=1 Tax=Pandoraea sp. SD6-2 TaxID=1286093 RepID=UPI001186007B
MGNNLGWAAAGIVSASVPMMDCCRKHGISEAAVDNWCSRYGGMDVSGARRRKRTSGSSAWSPTRRATSGS